MPRASDRPPFIARLVAFCADRAWVVAIAGFGLGLAAATYAIGHFAINTDTGALLSPKLPYHRGQVAFARAFPRTDNLIVVVVDGRTPELAEAGAAGLADKLASQPALFSNVRRPDGGPFWSQEGLLFAPAADVKTDMDRLIAAEPFLGPVAADPSMRGLMGALSTALKGVTTGQATLSSLRTPIARLADALEAVEAGKPAFFSWRTLITGAAADPHELRKLVLVNPKLDYTQLEPGAKASQAIRDTARALGLTPDQGVTVRLTGNIPLQDDEFGSLSERALPIALTAFAAIVLMLWFAVRSARIIVAILNTTLIGLTMAAAFGLAVFHTFNALSIAFIPLFVGLGIDFGIQFSVSFRTQLAEGGGVRDALIGAGRRMGRPLTLAAAAIAAGFLAFAPTDYLGVSQLGAIAGAGMVIALVLNLTVLPALLSLLRPAPGAIGSSAVRIGQLDAWVLRHRWRVVGTSVAAAVVCAALLPLLHFDFNPMHLRNPHTESMVALADLTKEPDQSPNTLEVLRPTLAQAQALGQRVARLPEVAGVRTLADFVPADQPRKLAAISDASTLLDLTLNPIVTAHPPSDAETVRSLRQTATDLRAAAVGADPAAGDARRLAAALDKLAAATPQVRAQAAQTVLTPLSTELDQIRGVLTAQPITLQSLPPDITRDWIAADGRARLSITPKGDSDNDVVLGKFIDAVTPLAPDVTGAPIGIREGGRTVVAAFLEAGALSFVAITALLYLVLRRTRDVAITMAPIVLTGLLTLGSCVLIGQPLNFANIIALPLLFGIGVAFHIYFVMSWRSGGSHLLASSLARAIFFSALTTATGFGSLWLSSHPGTASMGKLLMISLIWTLVSALIFQPALMGPPPAAAEAAPETA